MSDTITTKKIAGRIVLIALAAVVVIHLISAFTVDRSIEYAEVRYSSPAIDDELDGYTIGLITDTHITPQKDLDEIVDVLNERGLDLLLIGGDIQRQRRPNEASGSYLPTLEPLARIHTTDGIYGVEGNHDRYKALFAAMQACGIHPLDNSGVQLKHGLYLAGVADPTNRQADIASAVQFAGADDFVVLLSHQPDVVMEPAAAEVDLMLSGHTHGGHVNLFGLWAPRLFQVTRYGSQLKAGWGRGDYGTPIYISRGNGFLYGIPRVFARPEVTILTLEQAI